MTTNQNNLNIIYQDQHLVVVNKPSGLLSVPGRTPQLQDCIVNRVKKTFPNTISQPAVHRLDMDTSGLLILALTKDAHRNLSIQFQNREIKKTYIALLDGIINEDSGEIQLPFRLDINNRPWQIYDPIHGKIGKTIWQKIATENKATRIQFKPLTGRTHQLRLHAAHHLGLGTPIIGDRLYGTGTKPGQLKLHASSITFKHPKTKNSITLTNPPKF